MSSLLDEAYRLSPSAWVNSLGLLQDKRGNPVKLDTTQQQILDSSHKRIIINCHRQWGKSTIISLLCFHRALFYPRSLALIVSPSLRQSSENFRKIIDALDNIVPRPELTEDTRLSLMLPNNSRIISLPGSEKTIRGFSAPDLIMIDEASRAEDELFEGLFPMLLSNPQGRFILASTPCGQRGFFHRIWTEESNAWMKIKVIAPENPRVRAEDLEEFEAEFGPYIYAQEFLGEFVATDTALFTRQMLEQAVDPSIEWLDI
jgi:Terminase large subunit, T4likevirus-type, N-terminal